MEDNITPTEEQLEQVEKFMGIDETITALKRGAKPVFLDTRWGGLSIELEDGRFMNSARIQYADLKIIAELYSQNI